MWPHSEDVVRKMLTAPEAMGLIEIMAQNDHELSLYWECQFRFLLISQERDVELPLQCRSSRSRECQPVYQSADIERHRHRKMMAQIEYLFFFVKVTSGNGCAPDGIQRLS